MDTKKIRLREIYTEVKEKGKVLKEKLFSKKEEIENI